MYIEGLNSPVFPSGLLRVFIFHPELCFLVWKWLLKHQAQQCQSRSGERGTEELSPHDLSLIREEIFSQKPPADLPCDWSWSPLDQPQANGCENVMTNMEQSPCSLWDCAFEPQ